MFKLQEQLRMQNQELALKNADLDAFASMVAHDLKTPLNAIIGLTEVLLKIYPEGLSNKQLECINLMAQSGEKMTDIINALLLLATISKQDICLQPLDMAHIFAQVQTRLALMLAQSGGELIVPERWPLALGYAQWVEEVWANYVSNALKYGGHPPRVTIKTELRHQEVVFWVEDNGPGLSEESQAQLFKPFSRLSRDKRSKIQGHGLGLSIVKRIVQKLGGEVGVESQEGMGSRFYFSLPRADNL
ncbi:sensor histidine kinase [Thioflexithrix psekupsensis]|uniref:histidine kinase n=1 Tax=Thioflexithrix psekupsensis TaxID=1570016 RepID=A0A251X7R3_9GAMM|nr:HAMP domain-containing sensor histidine kinase [Thioflexithrix psekupsensis]OUD13975.1 hypothetical protein TPSD3_06420 [Thioflexithrix psekupsensis]